MCEFFYYLKGFLLFDFYFGFSPGLYISIYAKFCDISSMCVRFKCFAQNITLSILCLI